MIYGVGFYQMAKIAVTPTVVFAEFIHFRKTLSFNKLCVIKTDFKILFFYFLFFIFSSCYWSIEILNNISDSGSGCSLSKRGSSNGNRFRIQSFGGLHCNSLNSPKLPSTKFYVLISTRRQLDCSGASKMPTSRFYQVGLQKDKVESSFS